METVAAKPKSLTPKQRLAAGLFASIAIITGPIVTHFEGRVLKTYPDVVHGWKVPTACDGHTGPELHAGQTFTPAECDEMRNADLRETYDGLLPCMGDIPMPDNELAAYLSAGYNLGPAAICRSSIPKKLAAGDHVAACRTLIDFAGVKVNGVLLSCEIRSNNCYGVFRRRAAESKLCLGVTQ